MSQLFSLSGPSFPPSAGGPPRALVILLHGWGADGNDLIGLAPSWAPHLPHTEFVSPHGPFPCDMGFGRQWFSLADRSPERIMAGVGAVAPLLDGFIDEELAKRGLDDSRLALVGFSQGTMMALHVGLRRAKPLAGIVGYSGRLIGTAALGAELVSKPPVLLIHGSADEMIPVAAMREAKSVLEALGVPVEAHERPGLGHGIDPFGLAAGGRFLIKAFAVPA